jgi:hypothetical protein
MHHNRSRQSHPNPATNGIFEPFIYKNDHFAKTGSGQTYRENSKKDAGFRTQVSLRIVVSRPWLPQVALPLTPDARKRTPTLRSTFPMLVPSLSWRFGRPNSV